ncbi:sulfotransferase [bacterium AH-315-M05]|nr:sulfotransferase [bacterium AH-315-M05]
MKISDIISELIDVNKKYFKELKQRRTISHQTKYSYDEIYQHVHDSGNICFVLSTGRCGTKLLTNIFESHPNVLAFHEPIPELIYFNKFAYENCETEHETLLKMIDIARYEYIRKAFLLEKHYVETNNGITFFAHQLAQLYPNAKFIHLIRHPLAFVRSGYSRGWYKGKIGYDESKIQPVSDNNIQWHQLSRVGKIAWLWNETNTFIDEFKATLPTERTLTIKSESLFEDAIITESILKFLKLSPLNKQNINKMIAQPVNKQATEKTLTEDQVKEILEITVLREKYYESK